MSTSLEAVVIGEGVTRKPNPYYPEQPLYKIAVTSRSNSDHIKQITNALDLIAADAQSQGVLATFQITIPENYILYVQFATKVLSESEQPAYGRTFLDRLLRRNRISPQIYHRLNEAVTDSERLIITHAIPNIRTSHYQ